jgi:putative membrane-bound dehydrogenase-like protein
MPIKSRSIAGFVFGVLSCLVFVPHAVADEGVVPKDKSGRPLNLGFETGTLEDWTVQGEAFEGQPIKGDAVAKRRGDMKSRHHGDYWIGGYEKKGDNATGTLTSVPFEVTHPVASFLIGGGAGNETVVEIVRTDTDQVVSRVSGSDKEDMVRVAINLKAYLGKNIAIRLVDKSTGGWGHLNFDDFRFHDKRPEDARDPILFNKVANMDAYQYDGLPPEKAAEVMTVPEGFKVTLFAGEPEIYQPVAMCIDDRGRVWVAEAYCYPERKTIAKKNAEGKTVREFSPGPFVPEGEEGDRIVIFEDTDGDGKFDKRKVFMENLNLVSGLEVGFGGVWIGAAPYFMFVPMHDDKPAGEPQILLDGWGYQDTHETLNAFIWGPDGWLYGCHGVFTHSNVGKPDAPDSERERINAGIWRYHPTRHEFEVFAHGTSNPWGIDFNDYGQLFCEACVIPHCYHLIQGGRYLRQAGNHFNPYTYNDIGTIADHLHYVGGNPHGGNNRSDSAGGGHAHCGTMIYLGGTWPEQYRNQMFMGNIHGRRINVDILNPSGSGYVASHGKDFLLANDAWARFINLRYGPDGNAYLIDWYDKQACHRREPEIWDRTNGRVYKISYEGTKHTPVDLQTASNDELVQYQLDKNDWYVRHARRILQERLTGDNAKAADLADVRAKLEKIAFDNSDDTRRVRGLWALHVVGGLDESQLLRALGDGSPHVRSWAIQLGMEQGKPSSALTEKFAELARQDSSPVVRLYLASALQRMAPADRWDILAGLVSHGEDVDDHNLPLMYWYAAEPLAEVDPDRALELAAKSKIPMLEYMTRRVTEIRDRGRRGGPTELDRVVKHLGKVNDAQRLEMLAGIDRALRGQRRLKSPQGWSNVFAKLRESERPEVRDRAMLLALKFNSKEALDLLRSTVSDTSQPFDKRNDALAALLEANDPQLAPVLRKLIGDPELRAVALRGLAAYDDSETPAAILAIYPTLSTTEKRDAIGTLAARASYATALLDAVASKQIPTVDITADVIRQLGAFKNDDLNRRIEEVWGKVRETDADRKKAMEHYKKLVSKKGPKPPDVSLGRALYAKTCAQCHTLFGTGGKIGPDITGSNRANLDYLLENILDPSAVIPKEYQVTNFLLLSGQQFQGIVREESDVAVTVVGATETKTIPLSDIDERELTPLSMMPEGQLKPFSDDEVRALFAYLQSPSQVPIAATEENAKDFFNGKDLTGWDGDEKLWSVENGEIVGKSPGIRHNSFLRSHMTAGDFRLKFKVKLTPNKENSGVQFRSQPLPKGEVRGYQADIGAGWWGKLYEEEGRALLWSKSGEKHVKPDEWNDYEIVAIGIRTYINGNLCVDFNDPPGARSGIFALQIHSGGPMEVRFKDFQLEVNPPVDEMVKK